MSHFLANEEARRLDPIEERDEPLSMNTYQDPGNDPFWHSLRMSTLGLAEPDSAEGLIDFLTNSSPSPGLTPTAEKTPLPAEETPKKVDKGKKKVPAPESDEEKEPEDSEDDDPTLASKFSHTVYQTAPFAAQRLNPNVDYNPPQSPGTPVDYQQLFRDLDNDTQVNHLLSAFRDQPAVQDAIHAYASTQEVRRDLERLTIDQRLYEAKVQEAQILLEQRVADERNLRTKLASIERGLSVASRRIMYRLPEHTLQDVHRARLPEALQRPDETPQRSPTTSPHPRPMGRETFERLPRRPTDTQGKPASASKGSRNTQKVARTDTKETGPDSSRERTTMAQQGARATPFIQQRPTRIPYPPNFFPNASHAQWHNGRWNSIHIPRPEYRDHQCALCFLHGHIRWNCPTYQCPHCGQACGRRPENCLRDRNERNLPRWWRENIVLLPDSPFETLASILQETKERLNSSCYDLKQKEEEEPADYFLRCLERAFQQENVIAQQADDDDDYSHIPPCGTEGCLHELLDCPCPDNWREYTLDKEIAGSPHLGELRPLTPVIRRPRGRAQTFLRATRLQRRREGPRHRPRRRRDRRRIPRPHTPSGDEQFFDAPDDTPDRGDHDDLFDLDQLFYEC